METPRSKPAVPKLFLDGCIVARLSNKNLNSNQASSPISSQLESYQEMAKTGKEQVSTISPFFGMLLMAGRSRGSPSIHGYMLQDQNHSVHSSNTALLIWLAWQSSILILIELYLARCLLY